MSTAGPRESTSIRPEATQTNAPIPDDTVHAPTNEPAISPSRPDEKLSGPQSTGKILVRRDQPSEGTTPSTPEDSRSTRQVIAVSASKGPAAFFNLSRKFLVTDEEVDLSALEGAIVSAVDAAHLLERSKLATIVRVQTSYVSVEPKRRRAPRQSTEMSSSADTSALALPPAAAADPSTFSQEPPRLRPNPAIQSQVGRDLRRSRIVITMRRTASYKQWLEDNPLQAIADSEEGDDEDDDVGNAGEQGRIEEEQHH